MERFEDIPKGVFRERTKLIVLKHSTGLNDQQKKRLDELNERIKAAESEYYRPMIKELERIVEETEALDVKLKDFIRRVGLHAVVGSEDERHGSEMLIEEFDLEDEDGFNSW